MGLRADNPTETILTRGLAAMIGFYFLGGIAGAIADAVVAERNARLAAQAAASVAAANLESAGRTPADPETFETVTTAEVVGEGKANKPAAA